MATYHQEIPGTGISSRTLRLVIEYGLPLPFFTILAGMHVAQLMPLPLTVSCFSKIQIGVTFLVPAHLDSPGKRAVKRVCVCVCVWQG